MKKETIVWTVVLLIGAVLLAGRATVGGGMARVYVQDSPMEFANVGTDGSDKWVDVSSAAALDYDLDAVPAEQRISWQQEDAVTVGSYLAASDPGAAGMRFSVSRTVGVWIAALFTLFIFSFLYKDNPFYKIAESVVVGVSAAYWMVVGFWDVLVPNLIARLSPSLVQNWAMPGLETDRELLYLAPLILGIMLVWRLAPVGAWISRWPLAFIIGTTAGIRLVGFIHADFLSQIRNGIMPLAVMDGGFDVWESLKNVILFIGVLSCIVYFFFSFEHKGAVGATARLGIWFLMITFGAAFGYTVMGRIALLAIRIEFLFDDWLWLIDPTDRRSPVAAVGALMGW